MDPQQHTAIPAASVLDEAFKQLDITQLNTPDKQELLRIFEVVSSSVIRNQIAFIFADAQYEAAIPRVLDKIFDPALYNNNGSLVYALGEMNSLSYFTQFIQIICTMEYEARLMAYAIVGKYRYDISAAMRQESIAMLNNYKRQFNREQLEQEGESSALHFIEQTLKLLQS